MKNRFQVLVYAVLMLSMFVVLAIVAAGCTAQQAADFQKNESQLVDRAKAAVDAAQKAVDRYEAQLAKLPADAPERKSLEKTLLQAQDGLSRAQSYLSLVQIGLDIFATPVLPPATQPAQ